MSAPPPDPSPPPPPKLARRLLEILLPGNEGRRILGELDELHTRRAAAGRGGRAWYWRQVARYVLHLPRFYSGGKRLVGAGKRPAGGRTRPLHDVLRDVRFSFRSIRRHPTLAMTIVVTLGLGLGATLTVFALVDGIFLHPVPVSEPDRVVAVFQTDDEGGLQSGLSHPTFRAFQGADAPALSAVEGHMTMDVGLRWGEVSDRVSAGFVTGGYFPLVGVGPAAGRTLVPADDRPGAPLVGVLGHGLWTRVFGRDPSVVGRTVELNGTSVEIVGVAPEGFRGTTLESAPDVWLPLQRIRDVAAGGLYAARNLFEIRAFPWIRIVGRLRPGATRDEAEAQLGRVALGLRRELGDESAVPDVARPVRVLPLAGAAVTRGRDDLVRFVGLLGGVVFLTLVVACANTAMLVTARTWSRTREIGVRQALGAGRWRVVRQLLTENVVLALLGGAAGLGLSLLALRLLGSFTLPGDLSLARLDLAPDTRLLGAAVALSVVVAVGFGLRPAIGRTGHEVRRRLRAGARGTTAGSDRSGVLLVAAQVGLSLVLLVGAALFTRTLRTAFDARLGFEPDGVAALSFAFRGHGYPDDEIPGAMERILADVRAAPGVRAAAMARDVPLSPSGLAFRPIPEGAGGEPAAERVSTNVVTPGYFETLGIPVIEGRDFGPGDDPDAEEVAVVSRSAAELFWPDHSPSASSAPRALGRTLVLLRGLPPVRVVGVVEDHKVHSVEDEAVPVLFLAAAQNAGLGIATDAQLLARGAEGADGAAGPGGTAGPGGAEGGRHALGVLRRVMRDFDPALPLFDARLVEEQVGRVLMPQRFGALILGLLSVVTLALSAAGVYGMVTFVVRRRTRELGIRTALGAGPGRVLGHAVGRTAIGVGAGLVVGVALAGLTTRFVESWLVGVTPLDPASFVGATVVLAGAAGVAALVPAWRAVRLDPRRIIEPEG